ncbi:MAG TPA: hypothetical protein VM345_19170 [Acidimicrobiales bacterium]|jgi:hypothetical protein|nr:hypothetical protein [Acidimicrobiales bacterium]
MVEAIDRVAAKADVRPTGVSAKATWNGSDATSDVPYCQGDITTVAAEYSDATLTLRTTVACSSNPNTSPNWLYGETGAAWLIELTGDIAWDYGVAMINDGSTVRAGVVTSGGSFACNASPSWDGDRTFVVSFAASCIGVPAQLRVNHGVEWDENPYGTTCSCPIDVAPDNDYSPWIAKGAPAPPPPPPPPPPAPKQGYWMIGRTGDTYAFGDAKHFGNTNSQNVVDLEPTPSGDGYWTTNAVGNVFTFGDAKFVGGSPALRANETVTSISRTNDGGGYWLFTTLGRVIPFGNARHFGDMSGRALNGPVLDSIPTASGNGYYMVASDGGIFTFGDAAFFGSMGNVKLNAPVQSLVPDLDGSGYWLVASDGGIFAFDSAFYGSMGSVKLNKPVTGMVGFGKGYLMVAEDGGIFTFGDAPFKGSLGSNPPPQPIVSAAILNT